MKPATRRRPSPLLLALVAAVLAASGCAASGGDDAESDSGSAGYTSDAAGEMEVPAEADLKAQRSIADERAAYGLDDAALNVAESRPDDDASARKVIAKGNVALESDDVQATVDDVGALVDRLFGEVTERETTTNKSGDVSRARLLVRIPVADFDEAFTGLQEIADLKSADTGKEDVTTEYIDTKVRIRAQRRSLARVEALLDRAQSISDIIRIEGQLTRRQADLDSLVQQLDYLSNQTSMSTITVHISLPPKEEEKEKDEPEETGFLAGLEDGWKALKAFGTDVATLSGQVLPFAALLVLVGGPLWVVVRRFRRPTRTATLDA